MSLPAIAVGVLFLGLSAFWFAASWWTGRQIDAWINREASLGRNWSCADRSIAGYPFRIEFSCDAPTFAGAMDGREVSGSLGRVLAVAQVYNPGHVIVEADGPLLVTEKGGVEARLDWSLGRASVIGRPGAVERVAVELTQPKLNLSGAPRGDVEASAALADFHLRRTPGRPPEDRAYDVASRIESGVVPPLDRLSGDAAPLDADVVATLTQADPLVGVGLATALERWRQAGGRVQVSTLTLRKGVKQAAATGNLGLDEGRRVQGRLELTLSGMDDLLKAYGVGPRTAVLSGLIAGVLGGKAEAQPAPGKTAGLTLPLRFENGRAFLGPVAVAALAPVY
ncbi:DUF2125 domain-containing protein [Alsobacter sp. SYSU M60028]|uniref:DUF2125 domain-containing protein n=1 Tax=Alsobacter ponti TaxID=2962936 RepID=A0ABT1LB78_9HYPH|nr:DUF2125 domain-containing protein [Alsobacter ponti]MCP8938704.1 DUF2125 domain-containing protein [Alsobacter ponti]